MIALTIARLTFREAFRRKLVWGVAALSLIFIALYVFGFHLFMADLQEAESRRAGRPPGAGPALPDEVAISMMVLLGMYTVNFLVGVMTIFASVGAIASEIESGTLHAIVPKPLARWEVVVGKYVGYATMLIVYIILMVSSVVLTSYFVGDYLPPKLIQGTALIVLVSMILLSLSILGSSIFSTMANGVIVFMLYGMAVTGGLVEQIGTALNNDTLVRIGVMTSLVVPSDSMWRLASSMIQPRLIANYVGPNPFGAAVPPSDLAVRYAMVYCAVMLFGAILVFRKRDL